METNTYITPKFESENRSLKNAFSSFRPSLLSLSAISALLFAPNVQADSAVAYEFGGSLMFSNKHKDMLSDNLETKNNGKGGFLELHFGVPVTVTENVVIKPKLGVAMQTVKIDNCHSRYGCISESNLDAILTPAVAAEYFLNGVKSDTAFFGVEVNAPLPSSDSDYYNLKNDGIGFGIYAGYQVHAANFTIGYRKLPVKAKWEGVPSKSYDFGGIMLSVGYRFNTD
ncbi:hypothetical protein AGMMS50229_11170 [Campylobacterota bacterium]|nr:hypothetical protein AGMMS50229_11170 [Campylobacterota bacterium]